MIPHRFWPKSEDCLSLNLWTQSLDKNAKKPVMVWFHGGGYSTGSAVEMVAYDGDKLSEFGDVVVVTVNHRLNILGYFDLSEYGERYHNSGNAGQADLVEALRWVPGMPGGRLQRRPRIANADGERRDHRRGIPHEPARLRAASLVNLDAVGRLRSALALRFHLPCEDGLHDVGGRDEPAYRKPGRLRLGIIPAQTRSAAGQHRRQRHDNQFIHRLSFSFAQRDFSSERSWLRLYQKPA